MLIWIQILCGIFFLPMKYSGGRTKQLSCVLFNVKKKKTVGAFIEKNVIILRRCLHLDVSQIVCKVVDFKISLFHDVRGEQFCYQCSM